MNQKALTDQLEALTEQKLTLMDARLTLAEMKRDHDLLKARIEHDLVEQLGGEKALGTNAEARKREMLLYFDEHEAYEKSEDAMDSQVRLVGENIIDAEYARDLLDIYLADTAE